MNGARTLDDRASTHYVGTGITPAMTHAAPGIGSQYASTVDDANGEDPRWRRRTTAHVACTDPRQDVLAIDTDDTQTRSLLQTDNPYPSINDRFGDLHTEANGDVVIRFGPEPPTETNANRLATIPGKSWFPILRLDGPPEAWFDKTWQPGEIQPG